MHDKLFFSLAILSHPIDPHTLIIDFLSYQASLAYNPKEFLGVITQQVQCFNCQKYGHYKIHCSELKEKEGETRSINCRRKGTYKED
jgi:hypothetical protein